MTYRRLLIRPTGVSLTTQDFAWRDIPAECSFDTRLDAELRGLGDVPLPHRDLMAVATAVFLADRTVERPRPRGWERAIELEVPVYDEGSWASVAPDLNETLEILSADRWQVSFVPRSAVHARSVANRPEVDRVLLFSGGADSLCGAIKSLSAGERLLLVSHWDWAGHSAVQRRLARELNRLYPKQVQFQQIKLSRRRYQVGGGREFGNEPTRRTRSLLFLALGLASCSVAPEMPLWMAENGYAALNPPLAGERRGALSTRTTHPLVLERLRAMIESVNGRADFENPFASLTKGEMYAEAASTLGPTEAASLLSKSHSCSHVRYAMGTGYPPETQCGVCFGCLVRRAAFAASGLPDQSTYLHKVIAPAGQPPHLRETAQSEVRTVRYAGQRGVKAADLLAMGLPDGADLKAALGVAQRGLEELARVVHSEADLTVVS